MALHTRVACIATSHLRRICVASLQRLLCCLNFLPHRAGCGIARWFWKIAWRPKKHPPHKRIFLTRARHVLLCCPVELRNWVSYIDHGCARKTSVAVTPAMAQVLRVRDTSSCCSLGDLGIILDAYRCAVSTHLADNAIGSSTDASRCSESYLPLRRDFRHCMTFGGCVTMFRQLVDHSMRQGCALLRCDVFRGRLLMRARARRCSSAEVPSISFKTNGRQSEGGDEAPGAAVSAACTVGIACMQLSKIFIQVTKRAVYSHPITALMLSQ